MIRADKTGTPKKQKLRFSHMPWYKKLGCGGLVALLASTGIGAGAELLARRFLPDRISYSKAVKEADGSVRIVANRDNPLSQKEFEGRVFWALDLENRISLDKDTFIVIGESTAAGNTLNASLSEPVNERGEPISPVQLNPGLNSFPVNCRNGSPANMAFYLLHEVLGEEFKPNILNLAAAGHGIRTSKELLGELIKVHGINKNLKIVFFGGHNEYLPQWVLKNTEENSRSITRKFNRLFRNSSLLSNTNYLFRVLFPFRGDRRVEFEKRIKEVYPFNEEVRKSVEVEIKRNFEAISSLIANCPNSRFYVMLPPANLETPPTYYCDRGDLRGQELEKNLKTLENAKKAIGNGCIKDGINLLKQTTSRDPNNPWLWYMLGMVQSMNGLNKEGSKNLEKAVELDQNPTRIVKSTREIMRALDGGSTTVVDLTYLRGYRGYKDFFDGMHPNKETTFVFAMELLRTILTREYPDKTRDLSPLSIEKYVDTYPLSEDLANLCGAASSLKVGNLPMTRYYFQKAGDNARQNTLFGKMINALAFLREERLSDAKDALRLILSQYPLNVIDHFISSGGGGIKSVFETEVRKMKGISEGPYGVQFLYEPHEKGGLALSLPFESRGGVVCFIRGVERFGTEVLDLEKGNEQFIVALTNPSVFCLARTQIDPGEITKVSLKKDDFYVLPEGIEFREGRFFDGAGLEYLFCPADKKDCNLLISKLSPGDKRVSYDQAVKEVSMRGCRLPDFFEVERLIYKLILPNPVDNGGNCFQELINQLEALYLPNLSRKTYESLCILRTEFEAPHHEFIRDRFPYKVLFTHSNLSRIKVKPDKLESGVRYRCVRELEQL